ncbi:pleckstrin homology domain-containing family S member 1-like isoform X2 [Xyrauchen texanus]|uniref:pleckstrin homology domain-containing family S member 1-like isoform X2 n=1 Tax=Xyrauchen texanus TaxID=154827 RepID=UPI0022426951|nr:pleckstrin homology domain-containing family S member 1-like isoform X2 [Xyrauchen texanus]
MVRSKSTPMSTFYNEPAKSEELYTGYLHKSPCLTRLTNGLKSWKRRFFVLSKMEEDTYQLAYFKNHERKEQYGKIDLSKVSCLTTGPEEHHMWDWIQKNFKCPPSSVLFLRVDDIVSKFTRDYFLIGKNSDEVDGLFKALIKVLKNEKLKQNLPDCQSENRCRSISAPTQGPESNSQDCTGEQSVTDHCPYWSHVRHTAPACIFNYVPATNDHYDIPRKFSESAAMPEAHMVLHNQTQESDDDDEDEDDNEYMHMSSVQSVFQQSLEEEEEEEEDIACIQKKDREISAVRADSLSDCVTKPQSEDTANLRTQQISSTEFEEQKKQKTEQRSRNISKDFNLNFNGNCDSAALIEAPPNKSETHTRVKKDICLSQKDLENGLIFTQEGGKPCVSECKLIENSCLFHKGDQILAFNDLLIDTVEEIHKYLRRLSKDEVKLTVLRHPGSQPLHSESYLS